MSTLATAGILRACFAEQRRRSGRATARVVEAEDAVVAGVPDIDTAWSGCGHLIHQHTGRMKQPIGNDLVVVGLLCIDLPEHVRHAPTLSVRGMNSGCECAAEREARTQAECCCYMHRRSPSRSFRHCRYDATKWTSSALSLGSSLNSAPVQVKVLKY